MSEQSRSPSDHSRVSSDDEYEPSIENFDYELIELALDLVGDHGSKKITINTRIYEHTGSDDDPRDIVVLTGVVTKQDVVKLFKKFADYAEDIHYHFQGYSGSVKEGNIKFLWCS